MDHTAAPITGHVFMKAMEALGLDHVRQIAKATDLSSGRIKEMMRSQDIMVDFSGHTYRPGITVAERLADFFDATGLTFSDDGFQINGKTPPILEPTMQDMSKTIPMGRNNVSSIISKLEEISHLDRELKEKDIALRQKQKSIIALERIEKRLARRGTKLIENRRQRIKTLEGWIENTKAMVDLYNSGVTMQKIADDLGVSQSNVSARIKTYLKNVQILESMKIELDELSPPET